jgi:hypothetical protein
MYRLALIIFVVSEKKSFEHFPIRSIGRFSTILFYANRKSKMVAIAGHRLTLDLMGKCSNDFFSETTNMIKANLYMNVWPSWMFDQHKERNLWRGPSNDNSWAVWFQLSKLFQRRSVLKHFSLRVLP